MRHTLNRRRNLLIVIVVMRFCLTGVACAQDLYSSQDIVVQKSVLLFDYPEPVRIRVTSGFDTVERLDSPVPAVICADSIRMESTLDCFIAKTKEDVYFDDPHAELVTLEGSHKAILFSANWNGQGSGATLLWALLVLNRDGLWKNLLPEVTTSNQNDHLFWHFDALSKTGFLSLADYIWGKGEDHYGAHQYTIRTYEFCPNSGKFEPADEFVTSKKFEPVDAPQPYVVVGPTLPEIQRRLRQKAATVCPK
ncbi:MAG TPA: hypothetical protein VGR72_07370 [Candidatus Acidoferrales bacterium]|nr:hypothetical protein [Candidatus Acidoferrales bacterium]